MTDQPSVDVSPHDPLQPTPVDGRAVASWKRFFVNQFVPRDESGYPGEFVQDDVGPYLARIELSSPAPADTQVALVASGTAVEGVNYSLPQGTTIDVPEGATEVDVPISVLPAGQWFAERVLELRITGGANLEPGADARFFLFVRSATAFPSVSWRQAATTGSYSASPLVALVELSAAALEDVTVFLVDTGAGGARATDYSLPDRVTLPAGTTTGEVPLTWTGRPPGGRVTVEARIANDRAAEVNRHTFSEHFRFEWGFDLDELGGPSLFPTVGDPGDPSVRGDDLGGCIAGLKHWSLAFGFDPVVRVPDGSGGRATILFPSEDATDPGCLRKSYEEWRQGGPDQRLPLGREQTLSCYVHRPSDTARVADLFAIAIHEREPKKQSFQASFRWPAAGPPVFVEAESLNLDDLVSWSVEVLSPADDPQDRYLAWSAANAHDWFRIVFTARPEAAEIGGATNRFLWPFLGDAPIATAQDERIGTIFWGVQYSYSGRVPYQARVGLWPEPKGGATGVPPLVHTWTVTP